MSRRIDIELTSALPDDLWTWRAAGAKQPKGTLDGSILDPGAAVGDVIKVEIDQEIDGITIRSVVGGRQKQERTDVLELLPTENEFQPVIETRAKRDRRDRQGDDRGGRRGRGDRDRGRGRRDRQGDGDDRRGDRNRGDRGGKGKRGGPSFTPPPEVPQRPKPKRLRPGKQHRKAVLADIPEEQRGIAEVALQGMGAVRQRLREENERAAAEGRSPMPEATVIKMAEDLLPRLRVAEWRDRAEAAQRQMDNLDLRDLRSVVAAAGDPAVARDESTSALAGELTEALATKQEQETLLWFGDVDAALAVGRVIRALRLSSQPPKAGVPFPSDIAQRLIDSTNASLAPMDSAERWIAVLEAAAFAPIRTAVGPVRKPDVVTDELTATVTRLAPALPQVAVLFEIDVDPKAPMPKPLRPGPRKGGKGADRGGKRSRGADKGGKGSPDSDRSSRGRGRQRDDGNRGRPTGRTEGAGASDGDVDGSGVRSAESRSAAPAPTPPPSTEAAHESPDSPTTADGAESRPTADTASDADTTADSATDDGADTSSDSTSDDSTADDGADTSSDSTSDDSATDHGADTSSDSTTDDRTDTDTSDADTSSDSTTDDRTDTDTSDADTSSDGSTTDDRTDTDTSDADTSSDGSTTDDGADSSSASTSDDSTADDGADSSSDSTSDDSATDDGADTSSDGTSDADSSSDSTSDADSGSDSSSDDGADTSDDGAGTNSDSTSDDSTHTDTSDADTGGDSTSAGDNTGAAPSGQSVTDI